MHTVDTTTGDGTGRTYYVAPHGNDGNPGTGNRPWQKPEVVVDRLRPGDTLCFAGGTYRLSQAIRRDRPRFVHDVIKEALPRILGSGFRNRSQSDERDAKEK